MLALHKTASAIFSRFAYSSRIGAVLRHSGTCWALGGLAGDQLGDLQGCLEGVQGQGRSLEGHGASLPQL